MRLIRESTIKTISSAVSSSVGIFVVCKVFRIVIKLTVGVILFSNKIKKQLETRINKELRRRKLSTKKVSSKTEPN